MSAKAEHGSWPKVAEALGKDKCTVYNRLKVLGVKYRVPTPVTCQVPGCPTAKVIGRGMCSRCYQRWYKANRRPTGN